MSKRSLAARRKRSASHRHVGHRSWILPGFAAGTPAQPEVQEPAAPAAHDAPVHPLEYGSAPPAAEASRREVAPPLSAARGRPYAAPMTSLDAMPEPEPNYDGYDGWHETGPSYNRRRYDREAFSWRERDWHLDGWKRRMRRIPALVTAVVIVLAALVLGFVVATRAARGLRLQLPGTQTTPTTSGVVIQPVPSQLSPTPTDTGADVGIWVSDPSPSAGSSIKVYVRLTTNLKPDKHIPVTLFVETVSSSGNLGPVATDAYGLATFTLNLAGLPPHQPVFISASATVDGQTLSADTTIVPG